MQAGRQQQVNAVVACSIGIQPPYNSNNALPIVAFPDSTDPDNASAPFPMPQRGCRACKPKQSRRSHYPMTAPRDICRQTSCSRRTPLLALGGVLDLAADRSLIAEEAGEERLEEGAEDDLGAAVEECVSGRAFFGVGSCTYEVAGRAIQRTRMNLNT